jgi:hypothetical protein
MKWNFAKVWKASQPVWPIIIWATVVGMDKLFKVQSDASAALVGVGLAVVIVAGALFVARRTKMYGDTSPFHPVHLPWGAAFVIGGGVMMRLHAPWNDYGAGLLALGVLYLILGAIAVARTTAPSAR